jgi:hypothetical protein
MYTVMNPRAPKNGVINWLAASRLVFKKHFAPWSK